MKVKKLLLCILLQLPLIVFSQLNSNKNLLNPFAKNNWSFPLQKELDLCRSIDYDDDGNNLGHRTDFNLDLDKTYFIAQNFGIGLDYCMDWWCESGDYSEREITIRPSVLYARSITEKVGAYVRVGGIFGWDTQKQGNAKYKDDETGYFVDLGALFKIGQSNTYFNPEFYYGHVTTDYDDGKDVRNSFGFNAGLQAYLGRDQMGCDKKQNYSFSKNAYVQGSNFLNFETRGSFRTGNTKTTYNMVPLTSETDFSSTHLKIDYRHYIIDNLGAGLDLNFRTGSQEGQNSSFKTTNSNFSVMPHLTYNLPLANGWNNWFFDAGVGFGTRKNEVQISNSTTTMKYNTMNYCLWSGYNFFINKNITITPEIGYRIANQKNTDTDIKTQSRSIDFEIGTNFRF